jgi:hypothetical protein
MAVALGMALSYIKPKKCGSDRDVCRWVIFDHASQVAVDG